MSASAVIARIPAEADRPSITYRAAGDRCVLIEYGEPSVDLRLNFFVITMLGLLAQEPPPGYLEAAPGLRSILLHFDPAATGRAALVQRVQGLHDRASRVGEQVIPSRRITLPIAFDDTRSTEAVRRYRSTIRADAPNTGNDTNIDYIVRCAGVADRTALYACILDTEWWNAFTGFFPGLPFLLPLDTLQRFSVPKYNPPRTWTAEGAVGIGGPCVAIYPVDSPGSYQLFGRTVPIFDVLGVHRAFAAEPNLIRPGDRVTFTEVTEEELDDIRRLIFEDRYDYQIHDAVFAVDDYLAQAP